MIEYGLDLAVNTVVTEDNVGRMNEMIQTLSSVTPGVKMVSFKSLITDSLFANSDQRRTYYIRFVDGFFEALDLAKRHNIWLTSPYYNNALCVSDRFCPGKFVVTSQGDISICHCVGSSKDKLYDKFIFGRIESDKVSIDDIKLASILEHDCHKNERCQSCIAHWHCAGGCYADNCTIGDNDSESQEAYCESMRYFMEKFIKRNLLKYEK
jgi:radical SAM protein with 4Fe4S-binding SPASM domain